MSESWRNLGNLSKVWEVYREPKAMKTISKGALSCCPSLDAPAYHKASLLPGLSTCLRLPLTPRNTQLTALEPWLESDPELGAPLLKSVGVLSMLRLVVGI